MKKKRMGMSLARRGRVLVAGGGGEYPHYIVSAKFEGARRRNRGSPNEVFVLPGRASDFCFCFFWGGGWYPTVEKAGGGGVALAWAEVTPLERPSTSLRRMRTESGDREHPPSFILLLFYLSDRSSFPDGNEQRARARGMKEEGGSCSQRVWTLKAWCFAGTGVCRCVQGGGEGRHDHKSRISVRSGIFSVYSTCVSGT